MELADSANWRIRYKFPTRRVRMTDDVLVVFQGICPLEAMLVDLE